ncbi:MAG: GNAT family N-acetyltransferase [Bacteroidia bacterium]|nr:GNAT family N-acetyltransferase [Bacteroidia bacterium]
MPKLLSEILNQECLFITNRISVLNWKHIESNKEYAGHLETVSKIMTPKVTKALPDSWDNLNTRDRVENWIIDRKKDSNFYAIIRSETRVIIGFLFLYVENETKEAFELRLGYLLGESIWGQGIGSELIKALVGWCKNIGVVHSISGGVEKENIASIKVLEKNGFYKSDEKLPGGTFLYKIDFEAL